MSKSNNFIKYQQIDTMAELTLDNLEKMLNSGRVNIFDKKGKLHPQVEKALTAAEDASDSEIEQKRKIFLKAVERYMEPLKQGFNDFAKYEKGNTIGVQYVKNTSSDYLFLLAVETESQEIIKLLSENHLIPPKKMFVDFYNAEQPKKGDFIKEMIEKNLINITSFPLDKDSAPGLDVLRKCKNNFWDDVRDQKEEIDKNQQDNKGEKTQKKPKQKYDSLYFGYLSKIEDAVERGVPPILDDKEKFFLSSDLKSVELLHEKSLIDLSSKYLVKNHINSEVEQYINTMKQSSFIVDYPVQNGNVAMLQNLKEHNLELFNFLFTGYKESLKASVAIVLRSGDDAQIVYKIGQNILDEVGLSTKEQRDKFLNPNLIDKFVEKICKIFGGEGKEATKSKEIFDKIFESKDTSVENSGQLKPDSTIKSSGNKNSGLQSSRQGTALNN